MGLTASDGQEDAMVGDLREASRGFVPSTQPLGLGVDGADGAEVGFSDAEAMVGERWEASPATTGIPAVPRKLICGLAAASTGVAAVGERWEASPVATGSCLRLLGEVAMMFTSGCGATVACQPAGLL
mmetsp:Transcript_55391/g.89543  ORF Transcript_55391/g.89543 Transcript_55391/m.89543 type:complete len:128 (+) Transcript_55391:544-927(+)